MKHIKIKKSEPIIGIPRLRNEIFAEDNMTLCCIDIEDLYFISSAIRGELNSCRKAYTIDTTGIYKKLKLHAPYYFKYDLKEDEIILMKAGRYIVNEIGELIFNNCDMEITTKVALHFAEQWGLTWEVESFIQMGYSPREALEEWGCMPNKEELIDHLCDESQEII